MHVARIPGQGWLALIGGGEFSFGETEDADAAWLDKTPPGPIGFLPAASGSVDYSKHLATYLEEVFDRSTELIPVYRSRDAVRGRNGERIAAAAAVYVGGGVADDLVEAIAGTLVAERLQAKLQDGGVVVAIAAAAQAFGECFRSLRGDVFLSGLRWLPGGVVETNFDPGHDRRLRLLMARPGVRWGLGIPAESAVLLGPEGAVEVVGSAVWLGDADGDFEVLGEPD